MNAMSPIGGSACGTGQGQQSHHHYRHHHHANQEAAPQPPANLATPAWGAGSAEGAYGMPYSVSSEAAYGTPSGCTSPFDFGGLTSASGVSALQASAGSLADQVFGPAL